MGAGAIYIERWRKTAPAIRIAGRNITGCSGIDPRGHAAGNTNRNRNAGHHVEEERDHKAWHRTGRAAASNLVVLPE